MSTTRYSFEVRASRPDTEPNPTRTDFQFFDIELNFTHVLGSDHAREILERFRIATRCPRRRLDEGLKFLFDFLWRANENEEFMADILSAVLLMEINPDNQVHESVQLILDVHATTSYEEHSRPELDRFILESERETATRFEGASESSIKSLKRVRVSESSAEIDVDLPNKKRSRTKTLVMKNKNCSVCLEDFGGGDEIAEMPCGHVFHRDCIVRWLETSHFCPLCRYAMPVQVE